MNKTGAFITGTAILMISGFIVRILGFIYRIYLSNIIGAEGMGLIGLVSPVYSLIILTLTSGVSIAVSKLVAEENAKKRLLNSHRVTRYAMLGVVAAGTIVSLGVWLNIDAIVKYIIRDPRTYLSFLLLIPCIPVIGASSALKGYYYGMQQTAPTAVSALAEQLVRIAVVVLSVGYFAKMGLQYACAAAVAGMSLGEIANLGVLGIFYTVRHYREKARVKAAQLALAGAGDDEVRMRKRVIIRKVSVIALPVSVNRFVTSIMAAVEMILIPNRLTAGGLDYTASLSEFGRLSGMAMPLIFFPSLVTSSLATMLVPAISEAVSQRYNRTLSHRVSKAISLTAMLGCVFTGIFMSYPDAIGNLLYRRENIGGVLFMLSFTCVFVYLQQIFTGVLNGLGRQKLSMYYSITGYAIRIALIYFFVPIYGLAAYIAAMIVSLVAVDFLNLRTVMKCTGIAFDFRRWVAWPMLSGALIVLTHGPVMKVCQLLPLGDKFAAAAAVAVSMAIGGAIQSLSTMMQKRNV